MSTGNLDASFCLSSSCYSTNNIFQRAIDIVQKAIDHDTKQNYAEACKYYQNSLDYFMLAFKCVFVTLHLFHSITDYRRRREERKIKTIDQIQDHGISGPGRDPEEASRV